MGCHLLFVIPVVMAALFVVFPLGLALPLAAVLAIATGLIVSVGVTALARPVTTGAEAMVGRSGEAVTDVSPVGLVRIGGELWTAEAREPIRRDGRVRIVNVQGATVTVGPKT
jgi:membrane-bound serine protease (ClpP class)